jgi:hypothetical protein
MPTGKTDLGFDVVAEQPRTEITYRVFVDTSGTEASLASIHAEQQPGGGGRLAFSTDSIDGPLIQRMLIDSQGNVGIGAENPGARLEVVGDVILNGPLNVQGALTVTGATAIDGDLSVTGKLTAASFAGDASELSNVTPADGSVTNAKLAQDSASLSKVTGGSMTVSSGNIGIGSENPISKLHIRSAASDVLPPRLEASAAESFAAGWDFYHEATPKGYVGVPGSATSIAPAEMLLFGSAETKVSLWAGGNRSVTVNTNGNVGIGTTDPDRPLAIKATFPSEELISFKDPSGATKWHLNQKLGGSFPGLNFVESGVADGRLFLQAGGNVGIGTTHPQRKLQIGGDDITGLSYEPGSWEDTPNAGVLRFGDGTGWQLHFGRSREGSGGPMNFRAVGLVMTIHDSGDVRVQGRVHARGFPTTSDADCKSEITHLTDVLEKLDNLRAITFSWKGLPESQDHRAGRNEIGVIAQEIEAVFPELVTTSEEGYKAVDYGRFSAVLLEAVKELKAEVEALAQKIAALQS